MNSSTDWAEPISHSPGSHTGGKLPTAAEPIALWQDEERDQDDATKYDANQNDMHKNSLEKIQFTIRGPGRAVIRGTSSFTWSGG